MKKWVFLLILSGFLLGPIFPGPLAPALATVTDTYTPVQLTGDGSDTTFDFDFKIFNNTDLVVATVDPDTLVATEQVLGTDYTVSINTSTAGGTVTFVSAPDDGDYVSIRRNMPVTQTTDIPSGGLFRERQIENALDKQTLVSQQLKEFQDRSISQSLYATAIADLKLPLPSAGKGLKWNDAADGLENSDTAIDDVIDAAAASAASAASSASTATTQAGLATTAKNAAVVAQGLAETAKTNAESAQIAAESARDLAQTYAGTATTQAGIATTQAGLASGYKDTATTQAGIATTQAGLASGYKDTATTQAGIATTQAGLATTAKNDAVTAQGLAETARDTAQNYASALKSTSTSSLAIGTGSKTFTTQSGKQFAAGQYVIAVSDANSANYMHGQVTSYSGTSLVVEVSNTGGSGTLADWTISVSGSRGTQGPTGSIPVAAGAGTVDAITADFTPDVALADLTLVAVVASGANTSTTPTFAPDGLTAHTIVKKGGSVLAVGDISASGFVMILEYNLANTRWELLNPANVVSADGTVNPTNLLSNGDFEAWSAGTSAAPDGWYKDAGSIAREATIVKCGTYSAKSTRAGANTNLYTFAHFAKGLPYWKGRTVTFGCWVYATVADRARIGIQDGIGTSYSSYHTGDSTWQFLTVTQTISTGSITQILVTGVIDTGDTSAYFDGAICVEGSSAFAPSPKPLSLNFGVDGEASDTYVATMSDVGAYIPGMMVTFKANTANTGAASININGLGAKTIVKAVDTALSNNDILAGMFCVIVYDGTNFVLMNPRAL